MADPTRRVLWVDASAGIAGDMLLGALVDAGAGREVVLAAVRAVAPEVEVEWEQTRRAGFRALHAVVSTNAASPDRDHAAIRGLIDAAPLPGPVATWATEVFTTLVTAEARVHGIPVDEVHVHEVGAWDSIADVVGVCAAVADLGVDDVVVSPIAVGGGRIRAEHGDLPVPPPVVTELMLGWEVAAGGDTELATPTGVALATTLASAQGPIPAGRVTAVGVGAGTRDTPGMANVVRAVVLEVPQRPTELTEDLVELSSTVDDLDPRVWPSVLDRLLADGALDAWLEPALVKKGRPGHVLHVLCRPPDRARLGDVVLRHTTTLGYRSVTVSRTSLDRSWVDVAVPGGTVPVKIAHTDGLVVRAVPEHDECAALAGERDIPVRQVLNEADQAAASLGLLPGAPVPADARASRR